MTKEDEVKIKKMVKGEVEALNKRIDGLVKSVVYLEGELSKYKNTPVPFVEPKTEQKRPYVKKQVNEDPTIL